MCCRAAEEETISACWLSDSPNALVYVRLRMSCIVSNVLLVECVAIKIVLSIASL